MNSSVCPAIVLLMACFSIAGIQVTASAADYGNTNKSFLQLKDGSAGFGQLMGFTNDGYVIWQNEGFDLPFEFPIQSLQSISAAVVSGRDSTPEKNRSLPPDSGRFPWDWEIKGNMRLSGEPLEFRPDQIRLRSYLLGTITIDRSKALRISRNRHFIEPNSSPVTAAVEWSFAEDNNDWQPTRHGCFTRVRGSILTSPLPASQTLELQLRLRWEGTANFIVGLGAKQHAKLKIAGRAIQIDADRVARPPNLNGSFLAIEAWAGKLFIVQENGKSMETASLGDFGDQGGTLELIIAPETASTPTSIQVMGGPRIELKNSGKAQASRLEELVVRNQGNFLAIDSISARWSESVLNNDANAKVNSFSTQGKAPISGGIRNWDLASGIVQLEQFGKSDRLQISQTQIVSARILADDEPSRESSSLKAAVSSEATDSRSSAASAEPVGSFAMELSDGSRLLATILQFEAGQLTATIPGVAEPVTIYRDSLESLYQFEVTQEAYHAQLEQIRIGSNAPSRFLQTVSREADSADPTEEENGFSGTAYLGYSQLHGQLLDSLADSAAVSLVWKPHLSRTSSRIAAKTEVELRSSRDFAQAEGDIEKICALIQLVNGDEIPASITAIDEEQIHFSSSVTPRTSLPSKWIRSVAFKNTVLQPSMSEAQKHRLLTVPRSQQNDPPSHLLLSSTGDVLKGRLTRLSDGSVSVEIRKRIVQLPLDQIQQIIWLHHRSWENEPENDSYFVQVVRADSETTTLGAVRIEQGRLLGNSPIFGDVDVELRHLRRIAIGSDSQKEEYQLSLSSEAD